LTQFRFTQLNFKIAVALRRTSPPRPNS